MLAQGKKNENRDAKVRQRRLGLGQIFIFGGLIGEGI